MNKFNFVVVFLAFILVSAPLRAAETAKKAPAKTAQAAKPKEKSQAYAADGAGSVEFLAVGKPAMIKIVGKGTGPKGELEAKGDTIRGSLKFDLNTIDTGMKLRNEHTKEKYLEVGKYPEAELALEPLTIAELADSGDFAKEKLPFKGKLKLHGAENPVSGEANVSRKGKDLLVKAEFSLKTPDFKIDTPKYMGITVADDVKVTADFPAKSKE